jgi:osmotically inducible protein OsmC
MFDSSSQATSDPISLPGVEPDVARRLVDATHHVCPYSRATHGNIAVETKLV